MKTLLTLFSLFLAFASVYSQSKLDEMESVTTNFKISSNNVPFEISKQILVKRPFASVTKNTTENESYGYGYAFTAWNLEFVSLQKIVRIDQEVIIRPRKSRPVRNRYKITLKDKSGNVLIDTYIGQRHVRS